MCARLRAYGVCALKARVLRLALRQLFFTKNGKKRHGKVMWDQFVTEVHIFFVFFLFFFKDIARGSNGVSPNTLAF